MYQPVDGFSRLPKAGNAAMLIVVFLFGWIVLTFLFCLLPIVLVAEAGQRCALPERSAESLA